MGKPLTAKQKAANKVKLDEAVGNIPDPADELVAAGKKVPERLGPISWQIAAKVARKASIQNGLVRAQKNLTSFQKNLDEAQSAGVEANINKMADPSEANSKLAPDAKMHVTQLRREYDMAQDTLDETPGALKKLSLEIKQLQAERRVHEAGLIGEKLANIEELKEKARDAIGKLAAAMCMLSTRNVNYTDVKLVVAKLDGDKSVTRDFLHEYDELEETLNFDSL